MGVYDRDRADSFAVVDRWDGGFGWQAHPDERAARTSHAVLGDDGVWLLDPLDAAGIDDRIADLGPVAGVAVLSNWHTRDAGAFARRHDVPVTIPTWMNRVPDRVEARIQRFDAHLGESGFRVERIDPLPGWREGIAFRPTDGTLYTPDLLTTLPYGTVGDERVALTLPGRAFPPRETLGRYEPERILVGHGEAVFLNADEALADALEGARRRLPRALLTQGPAFVAGVVSAAFD